MQRVGPSIAKPVACVQWDSICARDVREFTEVDRLIRVLVEAVAEVRVENGFGIVAEAATAKSPNCKAGDGTAELRQVFAGEGTFPKPFFFDCVFWSGGLRERINGNFDLSFEPFVRETALAFAGKLTEPRQITAQPL